MGVKDMVQDPNHEIQLSKIVVTHGHLGSPFFKCMSCMAGMPCMYDKPKLMSWRCMSTKHRKIVVTHGHLGTPCFNVHVMYDMHDMYV